MKRKTRRLDGRLWAALVMACLLLLPSPAAAAGPGPESFSLTLVRPDEHTIDILFVMAFRNDTESAVAPVQLPLPHGYTDVRFAVAPDPAQIVADGTIAIDPVPLGPGEVRQYVYRAALPLPAGGTRLTLTLPWPAAEVLVLVDGAALEALPGPQFEAAGSLDLEGRQLTAFRVADVSGGDALGIALSPGLAVTGGGPTVRPSRWERLQANLGGRPAAVLMFVAAVAVAVWATAAWRRQQLAPAGLAAERELLVRQIASLDLQAAGGEGPPPGYEAERERLFMKLEAVARQLGGEQRGEQR